MSQWQQLCRRSLASGLLLCCLQVAMLDGTAADSLTWRQDENKVAAEISSWDLPKLLQTIAGATGWQIFLEPNTHKKISSKFKDRPPGEALRLLLGDLSFALLPQSNAPPKLFVFRTSLQEATELIRAPEKKPAKPIPNELIVTLKPGAKIDELAKKLGAKVIGRSNGLNAYRLSFDSADAADAAREQLKTNSDVDQVDSNYAVQHPEPTQPLTYSSDVPPPNIKPRANSTGGPVIGLIDTAIQRQGGTMDGFLLPSLSVGAESKPPDASPTHGTSMFETILRGLSLQGQDSAVKILPVDVYNGNPMTSTFEVASGIALAMDSGAKVINLSLGSSGDSDFLHKIIQSGASQGIIFFAAAGNDGGTAPTYPAAYNEVLAVTARSRDGSFPAYANHGDFVDLATPGTSLISFNGQTWLVTGTSASTAFASGLAAAVADQKLTRDQLIAFLQKSFSP
jgi:hypothetical protein